MSNQDIITTLRSHEIKTVGDLDHYASIRQLSRWHALAQLVGEEAADRIFGALAVRMLQREGTQ